ncbi:MAG: TRAP transporter TatT component family protein [Pseudomonadales bacterium]
MLNIKICSLTVYQSLKIFAIGIVVTTLTACSSLISSQTSKLADGLTNAVLNSEDLETVAQGAPAYLLLIDGLIESAPDDASLLTTGAKLNGAYAAAFVDDDARSKAMNQKALNYAKGAACSQNASLCNVQTIEFQVLEKAVLEATSIEPLYVLGVAWLGWLQAHSDDWNAIAQLSRAKLLLDRVVELDGAHDGGNAHLYLGGIATLLPPAMGGQPELGKQHFETAIALSEGKNLLAKVIYAQQYARLVFDQDLHDRLLNEVLTSDPQVPGLTLSNLAAKQQAQVLLDESAEYF